MEKVSKLKKNILFISFELNPITPGGVGFFLEDAIKSIYDSGLYNIHLLFLFSSRRSEEVKKFFAEKYPNINFYFEDMLIFETDILLAKQKFPLNEFAQNSYKVYLCLKRITENVNIDIVEFFEYVGIAHHTFYAKRKLSEFATIKFIMRLHGAMYFFDKTEDEYSIDFSEYRMLEMEAAAIKYADGYISPSNSIFKQYQEVFGIKNNNVIISPPSVPTGFTGIWKEENARKNIFILARMQKIKGVDLLIKAAMRILVDPEFKDYNFLIAGGDWSTIRYSSYKDVLMHTIPEEFRDRIIFTGRLNREQITECIKKSVIGIIPSRWESFCIALHELKLSGLPMIINDVPGFRDYFEDGINAIYFKWNNIEDLEAKIKNLLKDKELREKLASNKNYYKNPLVSLRDAYSSLYSKIDEFEYNSLNNDLSAIISVDNLINKRTLTLSEIWKIIKNYTINYFYKE